MKERKGKTLNQQGISLTNVFKQKKLRSQEAKIQKKKAEGEGEGEGTSKRGFFACYLLTSLSPRHKGHTYIGFTVNPGRRIRQHNGEIASGAWRTKRRRPWEMVLCIYGFPTNVSALQFEWAWQHPQESIAVRQAAATFKSLSGVANKIKLAYTMLTLPPWQSFNITVNYFSTKYTSHSAACPSLPNQIKVEICSMDQLPCYNTNTNREECLIEEEYGDDDDASLDECDDECQTVEEPPCIQHVGDPTHYEQTRWMESSSTEMPDFVHLPAGIPSSTLNAITTQEIVSVEMKTPLSRARGRKLLTTQLNAEIDVIDLLTPSPDCTIWGPGNKTRVSLSPEIIDLTL